MSFSTLIRRSTIAGVILATVVTARAGVDLTPSVNDYVSEGMKYQKLIFRDDKRSVEYNPPASWSYVGSAARLRLTPPKKNFAEATIEAISLEKPRALDQTAVKAAEERLIAELPPGSQFAKVEQDIENSVPVNGGPSFEIVISYQAMGEKLFKSIVLANVRNTQLVFRLTARKDDFETLHRDFKSSIFSWHWVEPEQAASDAAKAAAQSSAQ
jgi:hypothetical protein